MDGAQQVASRLLVRLAVNASASCRTRATFTTATRWRCRPTASAKPPASGREFARRAGIFAALRRLGVASQGTPTSAQRRSVGVGEETHDEHKYGKTEDQRYPLAW
jgi:hypothetical protein